MRVKEFNTLLNRASKDSDAFGRIYEFLLPKLVWYINSSYGEKVNALDIAHDFFEMILSGRFCEVKIEYPLAWSYKICFNLAAKEVKKNQREQEISESCEPSYAPDSALCIAVRDALATLTEPSKTIVRLKGMYGIKFEEISEILDINVSTVKTLYYRALKNLKKVLE